ncbi:MAG: 16S rRNA (cytosine(967)-C(5))-methyltransferase RsmB [Acidobacteriota bacterium]
MIGRARVAAYEILSAVEGGRADLADALAAARPTLRDDRDKALAAEIAIGVQRQRAALDYLITHFTKRPAGRLDREVLEILRLSAYQLLHLTRVPAAAVVDDAVNLTGRVGKRSASGLVNAVLRAISRHRHALPLPPRPGDPHDRPRAIDYLSITLSHPAWLAARWLDAYGFAAAEAWLQFNNAPAPLTLRANPFRNPPDELIERLRKEDVVVHAARFAPDALIVSEGYPLRGGGLDAGWFVVQDEASQIVTLLAGADPGARVLDTCAAPGGKTTALAAAMGGRGLLVACDVRDRRIDLLRRTVGASGAPNVRIAQADLLRPLPFAAAFDCVFVDAPCSGLGTLRRDPDIKWRRREDDLRTLAAAQLEMLRHAAAAVAPGGRLVYATCSSEPEENEAVVEAFLAGAPGFSPSALAATTAVPPALINQRGQLRTYPHVHGLEAFFGAVLVRHGRA